jgi:hypothetical protein
MLAALQAAHYADHSKTQARKGLDAAKDGLSDKEVANLDKMLEVDNKPEKRLVL